ncbi:DNA primase catalytic core [Pseudomonas nitritireducens]|uniref:DNA primase catalytic core n=1 Tax=Pseudomonas nitroreducens TaxID=46680 RepID=A0A7W7KTX8_PSENT|nr:CHC2 zinc finger domain-containing protein [Pseudomonas nitritireducens]MBB4868248.1 DNA primase catalytic core [Pseudomonas nitritireducens]
MARIPEAELERLKSEVSLVRLVESQGHTLTRRGRDFVMACVFHEEKTPSLVISPGKNLYHCFGCGAAGSVIDWVMKTQGVSLPHAVQILRGDGALASTEKVGVTRSHARHLPSLAAGSGSVSDVEDAALLGSVVDYYHANLKQSPEALAYLESRGLVHPELIEHFRLGYANKTLTYRLPAGHTQAGRAMREQLQRLGVLRSTGHEHLNGCLVVPVIGLERSLLPEQAGRVMQVYGRRMQPNNKIPANQSRHLYLGTPLRGVWNEAALVGGGEVILCESLIDALTFWCAGLRNVITAYGVNGFTADHWQALKLHGTRRVIIAFDRDEPGDAAAATLGEELRGAGVEVFRLLFPQGLDANAFALQVDNPAQALGELLQRAVWEGAGIFAPAKMDQSELVVVSAEKIFAGAKISAGEESSFLAVVPQAVAPCESETVVASVAPLAPIPGALVDQSKSVVESFAENAQGDLLLVVADRNWRVRGWKKNLGPEQMRVNVQVRREASEKADSAYYVDSFDLYAAKARQGYLRQAAIELGVSEDVLKGDLGRLLLKLEGLQEAAISAALAPKNPAPVLSAEDEGAALNLLRAPDLLARIEADLSRCGVVGEASNLLAGYLAAVSRKLDQPLAVLIQSSSAAGKSSLMDAVLNLMPEEERIQYSAMTGQSLFYLGETDLQHRILAIAEEEGVRQAAYALKLLQSDGELTIASTGKDEATGNLVTKQYRVQGPVMLMLTTTAIDIDEELLNRCLVLTINESREQTEAIHAAQRRKQTLDGLLADAQKQSIIRLHQNAQRLLKPLAVVNPYADRLTFMSDKTRTRRDHMKYLTLIRSIALLHQHQRPIKQLEQQGQALRYIEATAADIALANRLAHDILGRTLDELPPQTRRLLGLLQEWTASQGVKIHDFRFSRRDVRAATGWGDTQLKIHLGRLLELEYLQLYRRGLSHEYSLMYDGNGGDQAHLMGLLDVSELSNESVRSGQSEERSGSGRGAVGGWSESLKASPGRAVADVAAEAVGLAEKPLFPGNKKSAPSLSSAAQVEG